MNALEPEWRRLEEQSCRQNNPVEDCIYNLEPALPADIATTFKLVGREANEEVGESSLNISPWPLSTQVISQRVATGD
ncbi:hypothetical protein WN943_001458 [Citrus x changshan-huyou]